MPNKLVPINPATGRPYADGKARPFASWIGIADIRTGELKRVYERNYEDVKDLVAAVADERLPLKKVDREMKRLPWVPEVIFVNRRGFEVRTPREGQLGKWAVRDAKGEMWLFQLPEQTRPVPGRSKGRGEDGKVLRAPSPGPVPIPEVQRYSRAAHASMQESFASDRLITVFVSVRGEVVPLKRGQFQVAYKLDGQGLDTGLHEKLAFTKWEPFELTILKSKNVVDVFRGAWSEWTPLDEEKSVRDSLGRLSAKLDSQEVGELRNDPAAFIEVQWRAKVRDASGEYRLMGTIDVRKDAEMLVKRVGVDITRAMFSIGFRHTRLSKIEREDGTDYEYQKKMYATMAAAGSSWEQERSRDDRVNMLVQVSPETMHGANFFKRKTGKVVGAPKMVPLNQLDQLLSGEVQFKLEIKYFGYPNRTYEGRFKR